MTNVASLRVRRVAQALGIFVAGAVVAAGVFWAVSTVARPAPDPLQSSSAALVTVSPGEVGASITLTTVAEWVSTPVGVNRAAGVVTGVDAEPGADAGQGSVLYRVNERPVTVARGDVPAYRDINDGLAGADVKQVQQLLADLGYYRGSVDGVTGPRTTAAIRAWQKNLGVEQTGIVGLSDIIFIPTLPTRVTVNAEVVQRGASLSGGEQAVSALLASPRFTVPATAAQAQIIPVGTRVEITSPAGQTWTARAAEQTPDAASSTVQISLAGVDGASVCGDQCAQVPVTSRQSLVSQIVTAETVEGLTVPSSALVSTADGKLLVIDENGQRVPVTVVASARGMSVVEGVESGTRVRVPGEATP